MQSTLQEISLIAPMVVLTTIGILLVIVEAVVKKGENVSFWLTTLGLLLAIGFSFVSMGWSGTVFNDMIRVGGYGGFFSLLFSVAALLTVLLSRDYLENQGVHYGEYYVLIVFSTLGMMLMASAADLLIVFLGIELMSICLYVLAGFMRRRLKSNESALKYFLLGAFATGFLLYGIALVYGVTGTTNIASMTERFSQFSESYLFWTGLGLLLVAFAFKVAAVPFHMWVPDVYQGAPTTVTAFMSTGSKAAAFAAFVLVLGDLVAESTRLVNVIAFLATASMILGNIVAIAQSNIKRMLAYSSIAHAGYMLVGLAAGNDMGREGVLFYLTAYAFMNLGAFGILSLIEREEEKNLTFEDYAGLSAQKPLLAALMAIFMFSLTGIPPFAGFFAKYYVFAAAVQADLTWLAIVGVLTSVVSAYYYLRLVVFMYFREGQLPLESAETKLGLSAVSVSAAAVVVIGVFPSLILSLTNTLF